MKKQRYIGRIEFIAQKEYIIEKIRNGYTSKMIYDELLNMKNITISYRQFCRCIQQYSEIQSNRKKRIVKQKNTLKKVDKQNQEKIHVNEDFLQNWSPKTIDIKRIQGQ